MHFKTYAIIIIIIIIIKQYSLVIGQVGVASKVEQAGGGVFEVGVLDVLAVQMTLVCLLVKVLPPHYRNSHCVVVGRLQVVQPVSEVAARWNHWAQDYRLE
jgi:hypothetical protein